MSKIRILVDQDGILADLHTKWYHIYNVLYNDDLSLAKVTDWHTHKFVKKECGDKIYQLLNLPGLFEHLHPVAGAVHYLQKLSEEPNVEIFVCTAATATSETPGEKIRWLAKHFPWIDSKHIFTGYYKSMVQADFLIDDSPANLEEYKKANPYATTVALDYPYNRGVTADIRAQNWGDIYQQIVAKLNGKKKPGPVVQDGSKASNTPCLGISDYLDKTTQGLCSFWETHGCPACPRYVVKGS